MVFLFVQLFEVWGCWSFC